MGGQFLVLGRRVDVFRGYNGFWVVFIVFLGVGGVVRFIAVEFYVCDDGFFEFVGGVFVGIFVVRYDSNEGSAYFFVGQSVNDGVGVRVEYS